MGEIKTHSKPSQLGWAGLTLGSTRTGTISGLTISVITVRDARLMRPLVVFLRLMKRISRSSNKKGEGYSTDYRSTGGRGGPPGGGPRRRFGGFHGGQSGAAPPPAGGGG